jgi:amino-acid N-acetyltransferase
VDTPIEAARAEDLEHVLQLLAGEHLPVAGVREHVGTMLVARQRGQVVACAALEVYPDGALLRSVAVSPTMRGSGLGRKLTNRAIELARERGVARVYLLTTTAEQYFPRFGFERITRADVPAMVQTSVEFQSACPASAAVMRKQL